MNKQPVMDNFIKDAKHYSNTINKWIRTDGKYNGVSDEMKLALEDIYGHCRLMFGETQNTKAEEILWLFKDGLENDYDEPYEAVHDYIKTIRVSKKETK